MLDTKSFFEAAKKQLAKTKESQEPIIPSVAKIMGDCMNENGFVQLVGLDSGRAFAMELGYRAGGLMPFHQFNTKDLAMRGVLTEAEIQPSIFNEKEANASVWMSTYKIDPKDMFIIVSPTGCEPVLVELALQAKAHGHKVVAVVNQLAVDHTPARHSSGKKVVDVAEVVLNTDVKDPDTVLNLDEKHGICQMNSICGNVIAQMLTAETYKYLKESGKDCPVLLSVNVKGADVHNRKISDVYFGRWNS